MGFDGPLHECSIYDNEIAGEKLRAMLALGQSKEWQSALEAMTGTRGIKRQINVKLLSTTYGLA